MGLGREPFLMDKSQGKTMGLVRGPHFESTDLNEIGKRGQGYSSTNLFIHFFHELIQQIFTKGHWVLCASPDWASDSPAS